MIRVETVQLIRLGYSVADINGFQPGTFKRNASGGWDLWLHYVNLHEDYRDVSREEEYEEEMWMGSDSDFSDHALGIDY